MDGGQRKRRVRRAHRPWGRLPGGDTMRVSELNYADRAFAAMIGGQRFKNITREEAKRLRQPQPTPQGNAPPERG